VARHIAYTAMSSSPRFQSSPRHPDATLPNLRKSKFTYKQLNQLASFSTTTPLRTIAHVDLDCFYAQCEMVRLGLDEGIPLAVQQWQGLIAINYPARKFGLGRHVTATEAKKLCSDIVLQHVATWREGDEEWAYHADAYKHMRTHKASLDPYRRESRKIIACIKEALPPAPMQKVEKAGIDEVFLDLSAQVHSILLERFPELKNPPPYDDPTESLPWPSTTVLDWNTDALIDIDSEETEEGDPDWDDVCLSIAGEIVRHVRKSIREKLKYTCSGGIARNKMLAKLGSAHNKPNAQTVIRNRAIQHFLNGKKFTKIRNLGGKLGDDVVSMFHTDEVKELIEVPLEQLQKLGDDTGTWLYGTIRGQDTAEVTSRTQIKSMLSAKSFQPSINTFEQGVRWLRIFAADIFGRCVEEGVLENKRRPKTINLHHRSGGMTRSKQTAIPQGKIITEELLFTLAKTLLAQVVVDGRVWPCANLSLTVAGFEDTISGNMGIKTFLLEGEEAKALIQQAENMSAVDYNEPPEKRRKMANDGIQRFFSRADTTKTITSPQANVVHDGELESPGDTFHCTKCSKDIPYAEHVEHEDWHMAKELEAEMRREMQPSTSLIPKNLSEGKGRGKGQSRTPQSGSRKDIDKRQMQLKFGNG
jgi:DNA polymerase eta